MEVQQKCGIEKAVSLIGSKWVLMIIYHLCERNKGFNELMRDMNGISPRILSLRLKELIQEGLVTKTVFPTNPPTVEYALTAKGASLKSILKSLDKWADTV